MIKVFFDITGGTPEAIEHFGNIEVEIKGTKIPVMPSPGDEVLLMSIGELLLDGKDSEEFRKKIPSFRGSAFVRMDAKTRWEYLHRKKQWCPVIELYINHTDC